ncbi:MAG TPA: ATP-binding protein [Candidatus Aquicultor sp.]|jgi:anti-sigma regulatory factor (Ser/Thr protein kinase)
MRRIRRSTQDIIELTVPATLKYLKIIRQLILDVMHSARFSDADINDFMLAIMEAVTNSMRHSNSDNLTVRFEVNTKGITVHIIDQGCGFIFSKKSCKFPGVGNSGGRGLPLMYCLVDSLIVRSKESYGTQITMVKHIRKTSRRRDPVLQADSKIS